jgi:hypothetical protein
MGRDRQTTHWGKSTRIADRLRSRIVGGEWPPGSRLPSRVALEREYATTAATIQKALDGLRQEHLVVVHGARGTFVSDHPPHRSRIGIVFPVAPDQPDRWHRMYAAVDDGARRLQREGRYDLRCYYGVLRPEVPGYQQLLADIAADRLAGVFLFGMAIAPWAGTPLVHHPYLRVAATSSDRLPGVMPVRWRGLMPAALATLRQAGRRRVALIYSPQTGHLPAELLAEAPGYGLTSLANWCVAAWPDTPQAARTGAYLLLRQPAAERPDAILVADDYLAEQATLGIVDANLRSPEDVTVVVQCNFPYLPPAATPVVRLGVDLPALVATVADALLAPAPPPSVEVPLLLEDTWRAGLAAPALTHAFS